jgi:hypothetical protein
MLNLSMKNKKKTHTLLANEKIKKINIVISGTAYASRIFFVYRKISRIHKRMDGFFE